MAAQSANVTQAQQESLGPRLARGAAGGAVAGAVFIALNAWFVTTTGGMWTAPLGLISTLVLGTDAANPAVGALVHAVLSVGFGMAFALVAPMLRTNGTVAAAGGVFGLALFVLNFLILARTVFPQFQMPNLPFELVVHAVFGHLVAFAFYSSGPRRVEPVLAIGGQAQTT